MLRPLGRGLRDTLDNLLPFTMASFAWWLSLLLIVTAPAGTVALFAFADPRRIDDHLRLTRQEAFAIVRRDLFRAWGMALAIGVPALVLINNIAAYHDGALRWLVPLWAALLLLILGAGGIACSLRAVHGLAVGDALRRGALLTFARLPQVLIVAILLWIIIAIGGILVVPALMFLPALVATTANHLVYDALGITIADPLNPTAERQAEDQQARGGKYSVG
jgi:hypothetical protein